MMREGVPWALSILFCTDWFPGQFEPSWLGTYDFIFKLVNGLFEKLTCDAAALFANLVKHHSRANVLVSGGLLSGALHFVVTHTCTSIL